MEVLTKKQIKAGAGYASDDLRESVLAALPNDDSLTYHCAYTDYGGDFMDKVFIQYFSEYYPNSILSENTNWCGENAFIFGKLINPDFFDSDIQEFIEVTESYLLGFQNLEDFYCEKESEVFQEFIDSFISDELDEYHYDIEKVRDWINENKYGHYSILTTGVDYCTDDLINELIDAGLLNEITGN